MRSTGTVTCNDLEAESSAVFSTVMELIVRESTLSLTSGSIWTAPRQSLHCVLPGPPPAIAPQADPSQHSAALPDTPAPLGVSIPRILVCSTGQAWWHPVVVPGRVKPNAVLCPCASCRAVCLRWRHDRTDRSHNGVSADQNRDRG